MNEEKKRVTFTCNETTMSLAVGKDIIVLTHREFSDLLNYMKIYRDSHAEYSVFVLAG